MKYKVGDKVIVREDLEVGLIYDGLALNCIMAYLKGRKAIIIKVNGGAYKIDLDDGVYSWTDEMLEPYKELNKEHYAKEIADIVTSKDNSRLAVNRRTLLPYKCAKQPSCIDCLFSGDCYINRNKWANSEYVEPKHPIKLTQFEYEYLNRLEDVGYTYLARDVDNLIFAYPDKPSRSSCDWSVEYDDNYYVFEDLFSFVKWEDKEPYLIDDILENCEVVENVD